jgi:transposase
MRGSFECRTGIRTSSNVVKRWTAEDVEKYVDDPVAALGITSLLEPVNAMTVQINTVERKALSHARLREEFAPLLTVWGIGKILALTIMYEAGDISRFQEVGNFASYCRLVKTARLSVGKKKGSGNRKTAIPICRGHSQKRRIMRFAPTNRPGGTFSARDRRPTASSRSERSPTSLHEPPTT